jgi:hypothetical protein
MKKTPRKIITIMIHGFFIWALCGATIGIGRTLMKMETVLIVHGIATPLFAAAVSAFYFRRFNYTKPLITSILFLLFVMLLDIGLVAPVFEKSFVMFKSLLGTWIPFGLIFLSSYLTGRMVKGKVV